MELALFLTIIAGLLGVIIFRAQKFKNRVTTAKNRLKQNAQSFDFNSVEKYLTECKIPESNKHAARILLTFLADLLDISPEKLAVERTMEELFSVDETDKKTGKVSRFEPMTYQIFEEVESLSDKKLWEQSWLELPKPPHNKEEWTDFIMSMTTNEFLHYFSPLIKWEEKNGLA